VPREYTGGGRGDGTGPRRRAVLGGG